MNGAKKNIIFMGTPEFALPCLELILEHHNLLALFCQADKPKNRSQKLHPPHTKEYLLERAPTVPIYQPKRLDRESINLILSLNPDFIVVVAYGKILPKELINLCCINLHGSILPLHRGASPIQSMILNDDKELGISIMRMDEGMDSGPVLGIYKMPNDGQITAFELGQILAKEGARTLLRVINDFENIEPKSQDHSLATFCTKIKKQDGLINFSEDAKILRLKARAFSPWPGVFLKSGLKFFGICEVGSKLDLSVKPGQILHIDKRSGEIIIALQNDERSSAIKIAQIQAPSKKVIKASDYLNAKALKVGDVLDD